MVGIVGRGAFSLAVVSLWLLLLFIILSTDLGGDVASLLFLWSLPAVVAVLLIFIVIIINMSVQALAFVVGRPFSGDSGRRVLPRATAFTDIVAVRFSTVVSGGGVVWRRIDDYAEDAVVEMLIELLGRGELAVTDGASSTDDAVAVTAANNASGRGHEVLAAVRRRLLHVVDGGEMALEHVGAVEGLLVSRAGSGAERADHGALVVRQGMSILVVLAREAFGVVLACLNGAFLGTHVLVSQHVRCQILHYATTVRPWTPVPNA